MTLPMPADFLVFVVVVESRPDEEPKAKHMLRLKDVDIVIPISIQGDK